MLSYQYPGVFQVYYSKFDVPDGQTRAMNLQDLYDPENSIMTFEGVQVRGRQAILEKFSVSIVHDVAQIDPSFSLCRSVRFSAPLQRWTRSRWPMVQLWFLCLAS